MKLQNLAYPGALVLKALSSTYQFRYENEETFRRAHAEGGVILPFWHNRIIGACTAPIFRPLDTVVVVSRHADGELITRIMATFHHRAVRGSSKKGGSEALKELESELGRGAIVGITPDGPRGPRYRLQPGAAILMERTGRPAVPFITVSTTRKKFGSWDGFELPAPFTEVLLAFGPRIDPCGDVDASIAKLESTMRNMVGEYEARRGRSADFTDAPA